VEIEAGGMASPSWPLYRAPTLGVAQLTIPKLLHMLLELAQSRKDPAIGKPGRVLDTEIEAQVHGPINLQRCGVVGCRPVICRERHRSGSA
jgi:hypothetical protein